MKRLALIAAIASAAVCFAADIQVFGLRWSIPIAKDWTIEQQDGTEVLHMLVGRPNLQPRRPTQFALADTPAYEKVTVEADAKPLNGSLIFVYAYRDPGHFDYAHLSVDAASKQPVHNGIFHVYGGERVRISGDQGPASFPELGKWYHVKLDYDGTTGKVNVEVDGKSNPSLHAVDLSLGAGKVGIGSFFETADFRNVKITGTTAR